MTTGGSDESGGSTETVRLRHEIEQTRAQMSGTIDEIQERLRPSNLIDQATDAVKDRAGDTLRGMMANTSDAAGRLSDEARRSASTLVEMAEAHPVSAALLMAGAAWAMARTRTDLSGNGSSTGALMGAFAAGAAVTYLASEHAGKRPLRNSLHDVRDTASRATETIEDTAMRYASQTGDQAREAGDRLGSAARRAVNRIDERRLEWQKDAREWFQTSPLAAGAAALAAGLLVGLAVRGTSMENRMLGPQRDALLNRASDGARQVKERAGEVARHVVDDVRQSVRDATNQS